MGCYCGATRAPCSWCENAYECSMCFKLKNKDDDGINFYGDDIYCDSCDSKRQGGPTPLGSYTLGKGPIRINIKMVSGKECECGKDKHGFSTHSTWCPKYS